MGSGAPWKPLIYFKILSLRFWYRQSSISTKNLYNFACVCVFDVLMDGFFRRKSINEGGRYYQQSETSQVVPQHQRDHLHHHHHHYQYQHHQHLLHHHHHHHHHHLVTQVRCEEERGTSKDKKEFRLVTHVTTGWYRHKFESYKWIKIIFQLPSPQWS